MAYLELATVDEVRTNIQQQREYVYIPDLSYLKKSQNFGLCMDWKSR